MNPTLRLLFCCALLSASIPESISAQQIHHHEIILKTSQFSDSELNLLKDYFKSELSFTIHSVCKEKGWLLIEFPTALRLRMNQAEDTAILALQHVLQKEATLPKDVTREMVENCL